MVMEFLEGSDLAGVIAERGPMPVSFALRLLRQACTGVAEAHSLGIVHRDLKPQNLFLIHDPQGEPKIKVLDFGISKSLDIEGTGRVLTRTAALLGSPLYMAPEQMLSPREVDARADVWSLGVVLFEMLTARMPFEAETYAALCIKITREWPHRVTAFRSDVPPEVATIIDRCLEKDPARRYANASEVVAAIDALAPTIYPYSVAGDSRPGSQPALGGRAPQIVTVASPSDGGPLTGRTPPGWASRGDGPGRTRRTATASGLAFTALVAAAGVAVFVMSLRRVSPAGSGPAANTHQLAAEAPAQPLTGTLAVVLPPSARSEAATSPPISSASSESLSREPAPVAAPVRVLNALAAPAAADAARADSSPVPRATGARPKPSEVAGSSAPPPSSLDVDGIPSRR
jgi:serine/threonine-protein kinase